MIDHGRRGIVYLGITIMRNPRGPNGAILIHPRTCAETGRSIPIQELPNFIDGTWKTNGRTTQRRALRQRMRHVRNGRMGAQYVCSPTYLFHQCTRRACIRAQPARTGWSARIRTSVLQSSAWAAAKPEPSREKPGRAGPKPC
ncbi:hypothetical protein JB92DRAFT_216930 [Gautieria morchelliformis]|nr:hypothetical protein JB92DRAFT_216930 [Gautieria morchelliformis]